MSHHFSDDLQRLRYWQGQQLKSKDLRDQVSYNTLSQEWHNRALHNAYGVRRGLQVSLDNDEVVISSGIAYDIHGREIVLDEESHFGLPPQVPAEGLYLVVQRKSSSVPGNGISLLRFSWQDPYRFHPHSGVALSRLLPGPALDRYFNLTVARPQAEPRRFYSASLENPDWQEWMLDDDSGSEGGALGLGMQVNVDTSAAGFTRTPCYFVWLSGDLWSSDLPAKLEEKPAPASDFPLLRRLTRGLQAIQILVVRFGHIAEPTSTGFTYRLWMPYALIPPREIEINRLFELALQNRFTLNWLGIQMDHEIKENYELTG